MAAVDYFLKIDGIAGESTDAKHKGEIDVLSWDWAEEQAGSAGGYGAGLGTGKVNMNDFTFVARTSKASPSLMLACATGQHIKDALLTCRKAGGEQQEFFMIKFSGVLISNFKTVGSKESGTLPEDAVSLNFTRIEFEYKEQKPDGTLGSPVKTGYDLKSNKKV